MKNFKKIYHKNLGEVCENEQTLFLQSTNPDPSSYFVEKDGEIIEASKHLLDFSSK